MNIPRQDRALRIIDGLRNARFNLPILRRQTVGAVFATLPRAPPFRQVM